MTQQREFASALAKTQHTAKQIHNLVNQAFPNKGLSLSQCYRIVENVKKGKSLEEMKDQRNKNPKKTKRTEDVVELVKSDIEEDRRVTLRQLAARYDMSLGSMQNLVTEQLGMRKKSARWVPKLLSEEQKEERVRCSQAFVKMATDNNQSLNTIVTMDETAVSFHTPETKRQSKQ
jgi:histone-lysine N-methyltransferase SETMAR